jgi:hypothetical protein
VSDVEELARLLDERAIRRVLLTYCRGRDRLDPELITSIYHPGGTDLHGSYQGPGPSYARWVIDHSARHRATMHLIGDTTFVFDGDACHTETYVRATLLDDVGGPRLELFFGRYLDRFERRDGRWLIAQRVVVRDSMMTVPVTPMMPPRAFQGRTDREDPSYAHLAMEILTLP